MRIDDGFLRCAANYSGLRAHFSCFSSACDLLRGGASSGDATAEREAAVLYGMLHARYLATAGGLQAMHAKYRRREFQQCPRALCRSVRCLPYGLTSAFGKHTVRMFCPNCFDVYNPSDARLRCIDGACFGPDYVHLLLEAHRSLRSDGPRRVYVPRIFGFRMFHPGDEREDEEYEEEENCE